MSDAWRSRRHSPNDNRCAISLARVHRLLDTCRQLSVPLENPLARSGILLALILCFCACASTQQYKQVPAAETNARITAEEAAWRFDFVDTNEDSLGYMVLAFTETRVGEHVACTYNQILQYESDTKRPQLRK